MLRIDIFTASLKRPNKWRQLERSRPARSTERIMIRAEIQEEIESAEIEKMLTALDVELAEIELQHQKDLAREAGEERIAEGQRRLETFRRVELYSTIPLFLLGSRRRR